MKYTTIKVVALLAATAVVSNANEGPCDIYARANTPCVAAHSLTRALYGNYNGNLYQVRRADGETKDIPVERTFRSKPREVMSNLPCKTISVQAPNAQFQSFMTRVVTKTI